MENKNELSELDKLEKTLIRQNCMDLTLYQIIKQSEYQNEDLDDTLINDLHTLLNESSISPREKEICHKYLKMLLNRDYNNEES